ncbi:hypothetical protein [Halapricum desulfuricans]|uniref:Cell surface protein n=1 Tax=Halapricum desulfuricans TaxID=2841257 RepID=A0A897NUT8_9EURY|nr:hypothetical protein [Halapricum desulfuricans]QSG16011.1 Cell surface protein [Halapricum desulfuricans]
MTRTALLVAVLVASTALLVSTGAVPFSDGTDEIEGSDIVMQPADGPNGKYAVIDGDGEIALLLADENPDLEAGGVADDAVTPLDRVFTITYTGDLFARVWITDDAEDVRFYRGDDPDDPLEGAGNAVTLGPNETVRVGLLVDTRGDHDVESVSSFDVRARQATPTETSTETPTTEPESPTETPVTDDPTDTPTAEPEPPTETTQTSTDTPPTDTSTPIDTTTDTPTTPTRSATETASTVTTTIELAPPAEPPTNGTTTDADDAQQPPAGGLPSEVGGFGSPVLLPVLLVLALLLAALAWYRR